MPDLKDRAAVIRSRYNECFGCGLGNPIGLHLDNFAVDSGSITARFRPRHHYSGFAGILHGGIIATLLDETMAWSAMLLEGTFVVTANLDLKYRKPAPADAEYQVRGTVVERRGRRLRIQGEALVGATVIAQAAGLFLATEPVET
ncbi:MAG: PaaI family thioesterase [bacterium]|nr:PaaI family thioesterase [bacterium]